LSPDRLIEAALDPRESRRTRIARRITIGSFFTLLTIALIGILYLVSLMRDTQLDNRSTLRTSADSAQAAEETADRIQDCTEPGGQCFAESQERTRQLVTQIVSELITTRHISVLAAACSTDPALEGLTRAERIDAVDRCVKLALRAEKQADNAR
jgi:hypothetical protein